MFSLFLWICKISEGSQKNTFLEWSKVDLNVWNVSFGGVFLLKSGFGIFVPSMEPVFWHMVFWINAYILVILGTLKTGFPSPQQKIQDHFSIEIPPQNLHSTPLDQRLTTLKCCFGYPLIFGGFEVIMKTLKCQFSKICLIKKLHQWY